MRNMSQEYQAAKCGPDFQMFQELGVLGEMARRGGKSSFSSSRPPKASQPARVGLDAVLLQGADRLENDIKEALADIRSSSRARAASMELAMQDAAAAVAASSAALAQAPLMVWPTPTDFASNWGALSYSRLASHLLQILCPCRSLLPGHDAVELQVS